MRRYAFPVAPVLIAVILAPLAETELSRALSVSEGDPVVLMSSPFTITLYIVLAAGLIFSAVQNLRRRKAEKSQTEPDLVDT